MQKRKLFFVLSIFIILAVALILFFALKGNNNQDDSTGVILTSQNNSVIDNSEDSPSNSDSSVSSDPVVSDTSDFISEAELSLHDSIGDCWISYKGKVYDITDYLPDHPGRASTITPYCGTASEFEQAFIREHGTSKASLLVKVSVFMGDFEKVGSI